MVEEGTFERVLEYETGQIKVMKSIEPKRRTIGLRGGSALPMAKESKDSKDGNNSDKCE